MVVDSSALLAVLFEEPPAQWVSEQLQAHQDDLLMSTVNLTECLILLGDRKPALLDDLTERILRSGIRFIPPTVEHAREAAAARLRFPLNLGDCFAYALARSEGTAVLTTDRDFSRLDVEALLPPV